MEHRGPQRSQPGHSRHRDHKQSHQKNPHQDRGQGYPPPDPREWDRAWGHQDPRFKPNVSDHYVYGYQQHYPYSYGWTEQQRPHSRHGYEYPAYGQWDYRDNYYYEQDYYRGQHQHAEGRLWEQQDSCRKNDYHENVVKNGSVTSVNTAQRNDQRQEFSQHHQENYEDTSCKDDGQNNSSYYQGTLESSKNSGLSSSSYELSLYINGAEQSDPAPQLLLPSDTEEIHGSSAPLKYSVPHAVVSFGPAGQLIRVSSAGFSSQKSNSQLEIHNMEIILSETQEQLEMRKFPGPLMREDMHKVDAMEFAHQMAGVSLRDDKLHDRSSAALLWNLLILLCRQNGQMVGSDIAELLVQGSRASGGGRSDSASLIDFSEGSTAEAPPSDGEDDLLTGHSSQESAQRALRSYTQLLLAGRKKEALESAMSSGLWGHALFLASKMDNRSYTTVLNRFTGQLTANDPLQTLFQLLSGRVPAAAACCGSEKWGDWRPHLAVILSNESEDSMIKQKSIATMGDTLASRGLLHAAHVCYLTAAVPFGVFTQKDERLVLLGSSHRQTFKDFVTNSAIRCTELFEYCQNLGGRYFTIPSFQVYKFLYASRLLDCGLSSQAFHYCEVIGQAVLRQNEPMFILTDQLLKLADRLKYSELSETGLSEAEQEPGWITQLRFRHQRQQTGNYTFQDIPQAQAESKGDFSPVQSPEPELLYYRDTEENIRNNILDENQQMTATEISGIYECTSPTPQIYAPSITSTAPNPDFTKYNENTGGVPGPVPRASELHYNNSLPSSNTINDPVMISRNQSSEEARHMRSASINQDTSAHNGPPKQFETPGGWFSGWFKTKPKGVQQEPSEQLIPPQTLGASDVSPPPAMFAPLSSSAGINPFSRKAGQQLG